MCIAVSFTDMLEKSKNYPEFSKLLTSYGSPHPSRVEKLSYHQKTYREGFSSAKKLLTDHYVMAITQVRIKVEPNWYV